MVLTFSTNLMKRLSHFTKLAPMIVTKIKVVRLSKYPEVGPILLIVNNEANFFIN